MKDYIDNMINRNVFIIDSQDMYYFEDLRDALIREIRRDTLENSEDKEIVKSNLDLLEKVYNNNYGYNEKWVIEELIKFGYEIVKVKDVVDNLLTAKHYFINVGSNDSNKEIIEDIQKVIDKITKYFNETKKG